MGFSLSNYFLKKTLKHKQKELSLLDILKDVKIEKLKDDEGYIISSDKTLILKLNNLLIESNGVQVFKGNSIHLNPKENINILKLKSEDK